MPLPYKALFLDLSGVLYEGRTAIDGAVNAGLQGCLVQTGKYQPGDETGLPENTGMIRSITALFDA